MINSEEMKQEDVSQNDKPIFKKKPKKNLRQRRNSDDEEQDVEEHVIVEEIRERQKLRQRASGVSLAGLALGKKLAPEEEVTLTNPLDIQSGGLVNMQSLRSGKIKQVDDTFDVTIGTQFSAETNKRDEDEEMMKYIELELQKRKGLLKNSEPNTELETQKYLSPEEAALLSLPEHLRHSSTNRSEEMLSNQMLNGIPEVDLGIDAKIKNIEATEEAKLKLIREQQNKKDGPSHFVPTNMAVNFMQHNRFKIDDYAEPKKRYNNKNENGQHQNQIVGPNGIKRATDDYHYDKFKKQFRRY